MDSTTQQDAVDKSNVLEYATPNQKRWHAGTLIYNRHGLVLLFFWLLGGDFAWQFRDRSLGKIMPLLLRHYGGSDFVAGLLLGTLPAALGLVLGPIVSYRSDRHRGRFGRRIPFLLIPTPIAFSAMILLAYCSPVGRWVHPFLSTCWTTLVGLIQRLPSWIPWIHRLDHATLSSAGSILVIIGIAWTIFELAAITCNSVHGALVNDVVPHPLMGKFFGLFRMLSLGAGILFEWFLLGRVENHFVAMFVGLGLIYLIAFSVMCLKVKEGNYPPPPPPKPPLFQRWWRQITDAYSHMRRTPLIWLPFTFRRIISAALIPPPVRDYARECFTNSYYLWFFASFTLANVAFSPINLFSLYYAQSVGLSMTTYGRFSALQYICSMLQAPLLGWLCDKFHPVRMTIIALAMYATVTMLAFFFVRDWKMFAAAHVICGTVSGIWLTTTAPLAQALLPKMKFATFASALGVCTAIGSMITAPVVGRFLDFVNRHHPATRDYHYIYAWASAFITVSMLVTLVVHKKFMAHGGPRNYVAPE